MDAKTSNYFFQKFVKQNAFEGVLEQNWALESTHMDLNTFLNRTPDLVLFTVRTWVRLGSKI